MYLLYRFFNSVIFALVNLTIAMYTYRRFFAVMRSHYKLVAEVAQFNRIVRQSRLSLDYMNNKVSEAMKEIEGDIGKELYVTHNLTKISSKMALVLRHFNALEEVVIELVRMDHNTESIKVETPSDINTQVRKILTAARMKQRDPTSMRPKTPKTLKISTDTFIGTNDATLQNPVSKCSTAQQSLGSKSELPEFSSSTLSKDQARRLADIDSPVVKLLSEKIYDSMSKPIGFRPNSSARLKFDSL